MALVWLMIPGLGFFYSGLLRRKNALSMIFTSMASVGVVSFQVRMLSTHQHQLFLNLRLLVVLLGLLLDIQ
jgi:Ammonium Transporter Family